MPLGIITLIQCRYDWMRLNGRIWATSRDTMENAMMNIFDIIGLKVGMMNKAGMPICVTGILLVIKDLMMKIPCAQN